LTMAEICHAKGEYDREEKLLQKALVTVEEKRGPEHPLVGETLNLLGELYSAEGNYDQAESTCRQAVKMLQASLGQKNDQTAMALNSLAKLCIYQGKYAEAQSLCQTALDTLRNIFNGNHPDVLKVLATMTMLEEKTAGTIHVAKLQQAQELYADEKITSKALAGIK
jgi:tetratricopeptide (TPR) repeat protein